MFFSRASQASAVCSLPSSSISLPAGMGNGFLKMQPALGAAGCDFQRRRLNSSIRCSITSDNSRWPCNTAPSAMWVFKVRQQRYSTSSSLRNQSFRFPVTSISRTDSTRSNVAPSIAPAFMRRAPPTLPGIPSRNSNPLTPLRLASTETAFTPIALRKRISFWISVKLEGCSKPGPLLQLASVSWPANLTGYLEPFQTAAIDP